jgi:hypothetical protein
VLLPGEFPDLRSATGARLFFGTNAEFLPVSGLPMLRPKIIDLTALSEPTLIGHIYGGLVSDAPNNGNTHAGAEIFAVFLEPSPAARKPLEITHPAAHTVALSWPAEQGVHYLLEQSPDLKLWTELWPPPTVSPMNFSTESKPRNFFRLYGRRPTSPSP